MQQILSFDGRLFTMTVREEIRMQTIADLVVDVLQYASVSLSSIYPLVRNIHLHRR